MILPLPAVATEYSRYASKMSRCGIVSRLTGCSDAASWIANHFSCPSSLSSALVNARIVWVLSRSGRPMSRVGLFAVAGNFTDGCGLAGLDGAAFASTALDLVAGAGILARA